MVYIVSDPYKNVQGVSKAPPSSDKDIFKPNAFSDPYKNVQGVSKDDNYKDTRTSTSKSGSSNKGNGGGNSKDTSSNSTKSVIVKTTIPGGIYKEGQLNRALDISKAGGNIQRDNYGNVYEGNKKTVVAYYPDIKEAEAQKISNYSKNLKDSRIEILKNRKGERIVKSSSYDYIIGRMDESNKLNAEGWTTSELLLGTKTTTNSEFIMSPKEVFFDTSKSTPGSVLFSKKDNFNGFNIIGVSAKGGFGNSFEYSEKKTYNISKYVKYATFGVFASKDIYSKEGRQNILLHTKSLSSNIGTTGLLETFIKSSTDPRFRLSTYPRFNLKYGGVILDLSKQTSLKDNSSLNSVNKIRDESPKEFLSRRSVQSFGVNALLLPVMSVNVGGLAIGEYTSVKYGLGIVGILSGVSTFRKDPGLGGLIEGFGYAGLGYSIIPKNNFLFRGISSISPRYNSVAKTGLNYVEDVTVPSSLKDLKFFEGKKVVTTHVTLAKLPKEFITTASTEGAGGYRLRNMLLNFYKSSPVKDSFKSIDVSGYRTRDKFVTRLISDSGLFESAVTSGVRGRNVNPYTRFTSKGQAYLGYAGIVGEKSTAQSSGKLIFGEPKITILKFKDFISSTPSNIKNVRDINVFQAKTSGKTFLAPENLVGSSTEGQFVTPSNYNVNNLMSEFTPGSRIVSNPSKRTFTFYPQRKSNLAVKFFERVRGKELSREGDVFKLLSTTRYFKFNIVPSKTLPVNALSPAEFKGVPKVDVFEYGVFQESSAGARRVGYPKLLSSGGSRRSFGGVSSSNNLFGETVSSGSLSRGYLSSYSVSESYSPVSSLSSSKISLSSSSSSLSSSNVSSSSSRVSSPISSFNSSLSSSSSKYSSSPKSSRSSILSSEIIRSSSNIIRYKSNKRLFFPKLKKDKKKTKRLLTDTSVYVLPDLQSVFKTEAYNYAKFGRGEAIAPKLTKDIKTKAFISFKGYGVGFIPTEQMRTGKVRL